MLSCVPKRGRMIDTQKYIRDNLQAYADNKYFAFTKTPGVSHSIDVSSAAKRNKKNYLAGNRTNTSPDTNGTSGLKNFISTSIQAASITITP